MTNVSVPTSQFPTLAEQEIEHRTVTCFGCGAAAEFEATTADYPCFSGVACGTHLGTLLGNIAKVLTSKAKAVLTVERMAG